MSDNYDKIPKELRQCQQFVCWRYEHRGDTAKPTKVPYNPATAYKASVTDPTTWVSFDQAVAAARTPGIGYDGIGFVFTDNDPFCGTDLDVKEGQTPSEIQAFIFNKLASYAEASPSGFGCHIIVKGSVPAGRNSQELGVEVYSSGRFFTMTGNVIDGRDTIEDRAGMITELWQEIGGVFTEADGEPHEVANPAVIDDDTLVKRICASGKNAAYFNWTGEYDWSEAYRSVLGAACIFSSDEQQIQRVILNSPLVTKAPAHGRESRPSRVARLWAKEYNYACTKGDIERGDSSYRIWSYKWFPEGSRELYAQVMQQAHANVSAMLAKRNEAIMQAAREAAEDIRTGRRGDAIPVPLRSAGINTLSDLQTDIPPGASGELVKEILKRTRTPSATMATWAALGFVSGAVGRAYVTDEGSGVNSFFILSAGTNTGKTQHWNGLTAIVRVSAPKLLDHVLGGDTASPQIIAKEGQKMPSMVLRVPDAGNWLKGIVEGKNAITQQMRGALLNIYESAGAGNEWHIPKSIRAKDDKNETIDEFNMSLVLDTTPQYISDFDLSDFTDGLMSRFVIVYGPEVSGNLQQPKRGTDIPDDVKVMFDDLQKLYTAHARPTNVYAMAGSMGIPQRLQITHAEGVKDYMWSIDEELHTVIRDIQTGKLPRHYIAASRVLLNAKHVAACIAVQNCPAAPVVTRAIFDWSLRFVLASATNIIQNFDSGAMGSEESKQEEAIIDFVRRAVLRHPDKPYVTLRQLGQHADRLAAFSKAKMGARFTRQKVLNDLLERGILEKATIQTKTKPQTVYTFSTSE